MSNIAPAINAGIPSDLLTSPNIGERRLRVDVGQTGFFAGREFRSFYEFSIPTGNSVVLQFICPINFILFQQALTVDAGGIKMTGELGGTPAGSFNVPMPIIGKNRMSSIPQPPYVAQAAMATGGTVTGTTVVDIMRAVTASATAQQISVGHTADERGLPAGTYYLRLTNLSNGTSTGVYSLYWEERP